ncbi:hypothetical protein vseg_020683 [Gypsophila vaccaria]
MGGKSEKVFMVDEESMINDDFINGGIHAMNGDDNDNDNDNDEDCVSDVDERDNNNGGMNIRSSYTESWPQSYKETTDSFSIAASPSNFVLLKHAQSFTQSFTQSLTHLSFNQQDLLDAKIPLISGKSKDKLDKFPSIHSLIPVAEEQTTTTTTAGTCSVTQTVFNGFNLFVGIGLLSAPSTIQEGGWIAVPLFVLYALLCFYTGFLLRGCLDTNKKITSFPDLGQAAFGNAGRAFVSIIFYIELYFCCVEFIMLEADNLAKLFPNASLEWGGIYLSPVHFLGILAALIVLPTCYIRDLRKISFISACGVIGALCVALSLLLVGTVEDIGFHQTSPLLKWNGLPYAFGVFGFCYSGHSVLPNLYDSMLEKEKFSKALTIIFILSTSLYIAVAVMGFLMFGEDTNAQITLNLPANAPASTLALCMTVISPLFKYSLLLNPLARSLEEFLPPERSNSYWCIIPLRTTLVVSSVLVAFLVPFFGYVMAFTGSLLCLLASIVMPAIFYLKIVKNVSKFQIATCYLVAGLGFVVASFGTYSSIYNIIQQY